MDDDTVEKAGTRKSRAALNRAYKSMLRMLTAWEAQMKRVETGQVIGKSELKASLSHLAQAETTLVKEIQKNEERVQQKEGRVDNAPIDFEEMRNQIGSRLAHLRDIDGAE